MTTPDYDFTPDAVATAVVSKLSPKKYSTAEPEDYRYARKNLADMYGLGVADITWRVNSLAQLWADDHNGIYPSGSEMLQWDIARNSIGSLAAGYGQLPPSFTVVEPDGSWTRWNNDPVQGPTLGATQDTPDFEFLKTGVQSQHLAVIPSADLPAILAGLSPIGQPSGGGGGGGRDPLAFDRRQLAEDATNRWRGLLLEEPDDATLDSLVSDYIGKANAFWMQDAGRLDFDTFVVDQVRATDRHQTLYSKKPEFQSEDEYMGGFRQSVSQFGLGSSAELREVEAGATSGAGLSGFTERVSRTREARLAAGGGFSRQLANQMAQMGDLG